MKLTEFTCLFVQANCQARHWIHCHCLARRKLTTSYNNLGMRHAQTASSPVLPQQPPTQLHSWQVVLQASFVSALPVPRCLWGTGRGCRTRQQQALLALANPANRPPPSRKPPHSRRQQQRMPACCTCVQALLHCKMRMLVSQWTSRASAPSSQAHCSRAPQ